ncbi:MAG: hypothetical protein M0R17_08635 [Candidatus Omnitrophica bacterium]|jgi:hypothetical protein|nr:hypothetical protein [Candidatus Omnitrophota bacterium]
MIILNEVEIHDELNPKLWDGDVLKTEVRNKLLKITKGVYDSLKLNIKFTDARIVGSGASYNYTEHSDIDLHIIMDFSKINPDIVIVKEWFDSVRTIWNLYHDIIINGMKVELYLQDINEKLVENGSYSIVTNKWIKNPVKENVEVDDKKIEQKAYQIAMRIDALERSMKFSDDPLAFQLIHEKANHITEKLKRMRKDSLDKYGIYGLNNLVFKKLRNTEYLGKLKEIKNQSYDKSI